jgi:hypothetical protein
MAIDKKININENQVIFKRDVGHKHDGLTSSLIDYTKYSLFDFLPSVRASGGARLNYQVANERSLKTFIVDAVEERVLNPQGIRIQANAITANEIAVGTITANELVRDFIMVNNTMKSNNYVAGSAGWKISNTGDAEFNDVIVRGEVQANVGNIGPVTIDSDELTATFSDRSVSIYSEKDWGGSNSQPWTKIGVGVQDSTTGSESLSIVTPRGFYVFPSNTPPLWPYTVTQLTSGRLDVGSSISGITVNATQSVPRIDFKSGISGVVTQFAQMSANATIFSSEIIQTFQIINDKNDTSILFETLNSDSERIISTRSNGHISAAYIPITGSSASTVYRSGGFLFVNSSTIRIKENIEYIENSVIDVIKKLKPVMFTLKRDISDTDYTYALKQLNKEVGFITEDVEKVQKNIGASLISYESKELGKFDNRTELPPFSSDSDFEDIEPMMYKPNAILSLAVKAIQELAEKNEELESRLQTLEGV